MPANDAAPSLEDLDPAIAGLLVQLHAAAREVPPVPWSLARLSKRADLAMSSLRRALAALEEAGLVEVSDDGQGRAMAVLTAQGSEFCAMIFRASGR